MLWYKGWLETRFRLLICLCAVTGFVITLHSLASRPPGDAKATAAAVAALMGVPKISVLWICCILAGAGIATQPSIQASKGLHGSAQFTLSLPVSRLRLLATRALIGWLESATAIAIFCYGIWLLIPAVRSAGTGVEMIEFSATLIASASVLYFVSVLLATFLDDQWRIWGTMLVPLVFWQFSIHARLPAFADILRSIGNGSPLIAHTMPWAAIAFSLALAAAFFVAAHSKSPSPANTSPALYLSFRDQISTFRRPRDLSSPAAQRKIYSFC
jgi:hypothetical protein